MGLKGAGGRVKDKSEKKGGKRPEKKSAPANRAAFRFMWCCIIMHQPQEVGVGVGYSSDMTPMGFKYVCVCVCACVSVQLHPCVEPHFFFGSPSSTPLSSPPEQTRLGRLVPTEQARQWRSRHPPTTLYVLERCLSIWHCRLIGRERERSFRPPRTK